MCAAVLNVKDSPTIRVVVVFESGRGQSRAAGVLRSLAT
jgi:hypothetical protein